MVCNLGREATPFGLPAEVVTGQARRLIANYPDSPVQPGPLELRPFEAIAWLIND